MIDMDIEATKIREMLGRVHNLSPMQIAALPTIEKAFNLAYGLLSELLPIMFDRMMPEAMRDLG